MKMKIIIAIILAVQLSACSNTKETYRSIAKPYAIKTQAPEGPETYQMGWTDGCQSGMATTNTNLHMLLGANQYKINSELQSDKLYTLGWQYAYNHCGYSMKSMMQYSL